MKKFIGRLILKSMGWKSKRTIDTDKIKNAVILCGPHTSNWDAALCLGAFWSFGIPIKVFIKDDHTKAWYGFFVKAMGGQGVSRAQKSDLVKHSVELLKSDKDIYIVTTPEGSRSYVEKWKKGWYYIAKEADVPILFAYADYKKKELGITGKIDPATHSLDEVLQYAEKFFLDVTPKYPENYNKQVR